MLEKKSVEVLSDLKRKERRISFYAPLFFCFCFLFNVGLLNPVQTMLERAALPKVKGNNAALVTQHAFLQLRLNRIIAKPNTKQGLFEGQPFDDNGVFTVASHSGAHTGFIR